TPNLAEVNFHQGSFEAKNEAATDAILLVRSNKLMTEIKGKFDFGMNVDRKNKTAKIWVKVGQAKVTDDKGNQMLVNENETKDFSTEEIQQPKPEIKPEPIPEPEPMPAPPPPVKKVKLKRLTTNEIRRIIANQRQKIDTCYARRRRPGGGRVNIAIAIRNTGQVMSADVASSTFGDPTLENCVAFWMRAVKFPKFDGEPIKDNADIVFR
ncbi:MAG: AgmX/PglI C-terminal domain-containing protein, partial [Proteobacteria bacterium]|nr:AgmX/PglI C-terminal domain-containing protein [Pseudomonadota bacterium]